MATTYTDLPPALFSDDNAPSFAGDEGKVVRWLIENIKCQAAVNRQRQFRTPSREITSRQELRVVRSRILALVNEDDDLDTPTPSDYAVSSTLLLLRYTAALISGIFPRAAVANDGKGGIYIYWTKPDRMVQLAVPAQREGMHFIYHQAGEAHGLETTVNPTRLADWLNWFNEAT